MQVTEIHGARVRPGTFNWPEEVARAYDVDARKIRVRSYASIGGKCKEEVPGGRRG
jgi:hypothetical protein